MSVSSIRLIDMILSGAGVDLEGMEIKGYSAFPKAPALLESYNQIVQRTVSRKLVGGVINLCWDTVSVF